MYVKVCMSICERESVCVEGVGCSIYPVGSAYGTLPVNSLTTVIFFFQFSISSINIIKVKVDERSVV